MGIDDRDAPTTGRHGQHRRSRRTALARRALAAVLAATLGAGCAGVPGLGDPPGATGLPVQPTCGGARILIEGALDCDRLARIALDALADRLPAHLARGVVSIDVILSDCPASEIPQQVDCRGEAFAQMARVTFGPPPPDGPIEEYLTVAIAPVSGRVMGIVNPLIL